MNAQWTDPRREGEPINGAMKPSFSSQSLLSYIHLSFPGGAGSGGEVRSTSLIEVLAHGNKDGAGEGVGGRILSLNT